MEDGIKKILNLKDPPIFTTPETATLMSVALNHQDGYDWIYNNFIQTEVKMPGSNCLVSFVNLYSRQYKKNLIDMTTLDRECVMNVIIDFIDNSLYNNYYIALNVDTYFIRSYVNYQQNHNSHNLLIYGLDNNKYHIADFFDYRFYSKSICSKKELKDAILNYKNLNNSISGTNIKLISLSEERYFFSKKLCIGLLMDYLTGENSYSRIVPNNDYKSAAEDNFVYGINIYDAVKYELDDLLTNNLSRLYIVLDLLYKHKVLMRMRLKYLYKNNYISDINEIDSFYKNLERKSLLLKNKTMKLQQKQILGKNENLKYIKIISDIKKEDIVATDTLIKELN